MRKIRDIARLHASGVSIRQIARASGVSRSRASDYLQRIKAAGLQVPLPVELSDAELERQLFGERRGRGREKERALPDWKKVHTELRRKEVCLKLLWEEYLEEHPDGYRYSQFCRHYRDWAQHVDVSMRQTHKAGEKLFVDYAGVTVPVHDGAGGQTFEAQIFVAALGASHLLYAEATRTQRLPDWVSSHVRCFEYLGGVTQILVPDNLKSAVTRPDRYEPLLNRTYKHMGEHYDTVVVPARPRKPKDKAKVETGVQIIEREVLARIRNRRFFSLSELNDAIKPLLEKVNTRPLSGLEHSRRDLFEKLDKPELKPLPTCRYELCRFKTRRVNIDYHVEIQGHYYSVPYTLAGQEVEARITARMVEILHQGKRVASHALDSRKRHHSTEPSHMPKSHHRHQQWTPSRLIEWGRKTGPRCAQAVESIMRSRPHPEQGYRSCLGLQRLGKAYGAERLEAACHRALVLDVCSYQSIKSILKTGKDHEALPEESTPQTVTRMHANVRGRGYYIKDSNPTERTHPQC